MTTAPLFEATLDALGADTQRVVLAALNELSDAQRDEAHAHAVADAIEGFLESVPGTAGYYADMDETP